MTLQDTARLGLLVAVTVLLAACGAGGSDGDKVPGQKAAITPTDGPDSFMLFPNPQKQDDGTLQVASAEYATAYYEAIDPSNERDTLAKFKTKNGFGTTGAGITEETVVVGDQRDLGYGRRMTARKNADGTLAFVVQNYLVGGYGAYSPLNVEAASYPEAKWHLGTNAIEYSPGPGGTVKFVKFYTYDPITGARLTMTDLDGRGAKAMPTVCSSCHGGRGDPLTPASGSPTGKRLFPRLMNAASASDVSLPDRGGMRGDLGAQLHPLEPAAFDYSTVSGFSRALQETKMKTINKIILCSFPIPTPAGGDDACRRTAVGSEYQGTVATHLKDIYGGAANPTTLNSLVTATSKTTDTYVPPTWTAGAQANLYLNSQAQACRVCHLLRGTGNQSDIDFEDYSKFDAYSDRIKAHVLDRGNMPLAKLISDKYWSTPGIYTDLATYLTGKGYTNTSTAPGRPIADPGPSRVVKTSPTTLSAAMSLFSTSYQWSIVTDPVGGATISNATSSTASLNTAGNGTYVIQLITRRNGVSSAPATVNIVVNSALSYTPSALRFTDIKAILQAARPSGACTGCHTPSAPGGGVPPIWYTDYDRNADGATNATDDNWFYTELRGRINFADWVASPLLRKPSGNHHNGGLHSRFDATLTPGAADREDYDKILSWILNGAPE